MGEALSAPTTASDEPINVDSPAEPTVATGQADPSTTPIPEEPNPILIAQREWYDSQDKIFQGPVPPETPWQDDDLSAQPSSAASAQPMGNENRASPQAPDQEPWLLPKPDTCLFNIFGEPFQLQNIKEGIAKGQTPKCLLYKDLTAADEQPLNRQELWAATQYKPIFRTAGRWTYYHLLPEDIRRPPPQFCDEIEDAPIQPPAARTQPKEKARPKQVPPGGRPNLPPKLPQKESWADATEEEASSQPASSANPKPAQVSKASSEAAEPIPKPAQVPKAPSSTSEPTAQPSSATTGQKPEPPPQQHLRPPETQSFLPKDSEPMTKPMPKKPSSATQQPQDQPSPADRPGSSQDNIKDLSSSDPASVYQPQSGQDIDLDVFRSLDQPGACTQPYIFDISLLDNRAQPLYNSPHYQPIECMIYDKRPWICFYGGNPPKVVAETDDWWYTLYDREGGCCLHGWPIFLLQDFMRLLEQPPPSPQPTAQSSDGAGAQPTTMPLPREVMRLPGNFSPSFGRYWHAGCSGSYNPRNTDRPSRPPTIQISRDMQPEDMPSKKAPIAFPDQPWVLEKPRLPTRVGIKPLRGCLCLPAMILPESYQVSPAFARAYYMGNENKMHCLLPCSTEPFCPFHSACGRIMHPESLEHDDHKGHLCSRCKEFLDKGRSPFEWFDSLPEAVSKD